MALKKGATSLLLHCTDVMLRQFLLKIKVKNCEAHIQLSNRLENIMRNDFIVKTFNILFNIYFLTFFFVTDASFYR